jgi:butyrate kinase
LRKNDFAFGVIVKSPAGLLRRSGIMSFRVLCINPGSTSTRVAAFLDDKEIFIENVMHEPEEIAVFNKVQDQLDYRYKLIASMLENKSINLKEYDAIIGRGGSIPFKIGGVFKISEKMLDECRSGKYADHPSNLGCQLAKIFADTYGLPCFVVDPPLLDEFDDVAYISGYSEIRRQSAFHALNEKNVARRISEKLGKNYEEINIITVHLGSGISVSPHKNGKCTDNTYGSGGDGPFSPERSGRLPSIELLRALSESEISIKDWQKLLIKKSGMTSYFGTNNMIELENRAKKGDPSAAFMIDGMAHMIAREIAAFCTILFWKVDAIGITGAIAKSNYIVDRIKKEVEFIAPVYIYPGEFEMQALAAGGLRVLKAEEQPKDYF